MTFDASRHVLVACEFSGLVRDSLIKNRVNAISCDLDKSELKGPHIVGDVREFLPLGWAAIIAFPPCTYLCSSGARWWNSRKKEQNDAIEFVKSIYQSSDIVAIENPIGILSRVFDKPDQIVHPWQFGHGETKSTCLWLSNLPNLLPTSIVQGRKPVIHHMSPGPSRQKNRSRTYPGIADAMGEQWGPLLRQVAPLE